MASAPHGAGAHPDHESTAGHSTERRPALQEEIVARPQHPGMAEQVCPPDDAARTQDREGGDGVQIGHCSLLDVAQGLDVRAVKKFGSHAGELGTGDGVQQNIELLNGQPAPLHGGVRTSNHDRACDRRDAWVGSRC
jgi:hypothetical protein